MSMRSPLALSLLLFAAPLRAAGPTAVEAAAPVQTSFSALIRSFQVDLTNVAPVIEKLNAGAYSETDRQQLSQGFDRMLQIAKDLEAAVEKKPTREKYYMDDYKLPRAARDLELLRIRVGSAKHYLPRPGPLKREDLDKFVASLDDLRNHFFGLFSFIPEAEKQELDRRLSAERTSVEKMRTLATGTHALEMGLIRLRRKLGLDPKADPAAFVASLNLAYDGNTAVKPGVETVTGAASPPSQGTPAPPKPISGLTGSVDKNWSKIAEPPLVAPDPKDSKDALEPPSRNPLFIAWLDGVQSLGSKLKSAAAVAVQALIGNSPVPSAAELAADAAVKLTPQTPVPEGSATFKADGTGFISVEELGRITFAKEPGPGGQYRYRMQQGPWLLEAVSVEPGQFRRDRVTSWTVLEPLGPDGRHDLLVREGERLFLVQKKGDLSAYYELEENGDIRLAEIRGPKVTTRFRPNGEQELLTPDGELISSTRKLELVEKEDGGLSIAGPLEPYLKQLLPLYQLTLETYLKDSYRRRAELGQIKSKWGTSDELEKLIADSALLKTAEILKVGDERQLILTYQTDLGERVFSTRLRSSGRHSSFPGYGPVQDMTYGRKLFTLDQKVAEAFNSGTGHFDVFFRAPEIPVGNPTAEGNFFKMYSKNSDERGPAVPGEPFSMKDLVHSVSYYEDGFQGQGIEEAAGEIIGEAIAGLPAIQNYQRGVRELASLTESIEKEEQALKTLTQNIEGVIDPPSSTSDLFGWGIVTGAVDLFRDDKVLRAEEEAGEKAKQLAVQGFLDKLSPGTVQAARALAIQSRIDDLVKRKTSPAMAGYMAEYMSEEPTSQEIIAALTSKYGNAGAIDRVSKQNWAAGIAFKTADAAPTMAAMAATFAITKKIPMAKLPVAMIEGSFMVHMVGNTGQNVGRAFSTGANEDIAQAGADVLGLLNYGMVKKAFGKVKSKFSGKAKDGVAQTKANESATEAKPDQPEAPPSASPESIRAAAAAANEFKPLEVKAAAPGEAQVTADGRVATARTSAKKSKDRINEDAVSADPANRLLIVADGMGGHAGGSVASGIAKRVINEHMAQALKDNPTPTPTQAAAMIQEAMAKADAAIVDHAKSHPETKGMGTTASVALIVKDAAGREVLVSGNVGDSAVLLRQAQASGNRNLVQVSAEQSFVATLRARTIEALKDAGVYTPRMEKTGRIPTDAVKTALPKLREAAMADPLLGEMLDKAEASGKGIDLAAYETHTARNMLTSALGGHNVKVGVTETPLAQGDVVMAVSDGVLDNLSSRRLQAIARSNATPAELVTAMADESMRVAENPRANRGEDKYQKHDDISAAAMQAGDGPVVPKKRRALAAGEAAPPANPEAAAAANMVAAKYSGAPSSYRRRLSNSDAVKVELTGVLSTDGSSGAIMDARLPTGEAVAVKVYSEPTSTNQRYSGKSKAWEENIEYFDREIQMARRMSDALGPSGMAPKVFGEVDIGPQGHPSWAMEKIAGKTPGELTAAEARTLITPSTLRQAAEGIRKLGEAGLGGGDSPQPMILTRDQTINGVPRKAGDVVFMDPGGLSENRGSWQTPREVAADIALALVAAKEPGAKPHQALNDASKSMTPEHIGQLRAGADRAARSAMNEPAPGRAGAPAAPPPAKVSVSPDVVRDRMFPGQLAAVEKLVPKEAVERSAPRYEYFQTVAKLRAMRERQRVEIQDKNPEITEGDLARQARENVERDPAGRELTDLQHELAQEVLQGYAGNLPPGQKLDFSSPRAFQDSLNAATRARRAGAPPEAPRPPPPAPKEAPLGRAGKPPVASADLVLGMEVMLDPKGSITREFDQTDIPGKRFIENKEARGHEIPNPRTGLVRPNTHKKWAAKHIFRETTIKINGLQSAVATRPGKGQAPEVPNIEAIRGFRELIFDIAGPETPKLRAAIDVELNHLRREYPGWIFSVNFDAAPPISFN